MLHNQMEATFITYVKCFRESKIPWYNPLLIACQILYSWRPSDSPHWNPGFTNFSDALNSSRKSEMTNIYYWTTYCLNNINNNVILLYKKVKFRWENNQFSTSFSLFNKKYHKDDKLLTRLGGPVHWLAGQFTQVNPSSQIKGTYS